MFRDNGNLYDRVKGDENDSYEAQFCGGYYNKVIEIDFKDFIFITKTAFQSFFFVLSLSAVLI